MNNRIAFYLLLCLCCVFAGCANISTPTGGKRDKTPPRLLRVLPSDSLRNTRVKRIELDFDEYITVSDATKEVEIMPILAIAPSVTNVNKHVVVKLVDSLLEDNTTYRISFGSAIKDLHEGNPFPKYTYTFTTGSYYDSLQLRGNVISAATGLPDTSNVIVVLYNAADNDSAVIKKKPKYMTRVDSRGAYRFTGLPARSFRMYAVKDNNTSLIYDGDEEQVAFIDSMVVPGLDSAISPVTLRLFAEAIDTSIVKKPKEKGSGKRLGRSNREAVTDTNFTYTTNLDTASILKRSYDINKPVRLSFNRLPLIAGNRFSFTYDSAGIQVTPFYSIAADTAHPNDVLINTAWVENAVYRLQLDSAFATDTAGRAMPAARFVFRTNNDDDYGKIKVNLPSKYYGTHAGFNYVLLVKGDDDTVYQKPFFDTAISLTRLRPATYTFRIIVDKNKNGKWDTGDLLGGRQPEEVIPSTATVVLKTRFEHSIDFEEKAKPADKNRKGGLRGSGTPKK